MADEKPEAAPAPPAKPDPGPGVYQRADGKWHVSITDTKGKVIQVGKFDTQAQAREAYVESDRNLRPAGPPAPTNGGGVVHSLSAVDLTTTKPSSTFKK